MRDSEFLEKRRVKMEKMAKDAGVRVTYCGSNWWELEAGGLKRKIRGVVPVTRELEALKATGV